MFQFTVRRIIFTVPTVILTVSIIFFVLRVLPGNPAVLILGDSASAEQIANLQAKLGTDLPLWQQYINYAVNIIQGDFGNSLTTGRPVTEQLLSMIPYTLELALAAVFIGALIGIPAGIVSALKRNTFIDGTFRLGALIGISMPAFFLGLLLLIAFSLKIPIFPSLGAGEGILENLHHLILPAFTLGLINAALVMRITRASMLEEVNRDYVRAARAKGLPKSKVVGKHILRNTLIPVITVIGLDITTLISGAVLTEAVFSRPGLGSLAVGAIKTRDYPTLQACLILFAVLVIFVNLLVDLSYSVINPKIRAK